jgi:hypothetical protein
MRRPRDGLIYRAVSGQRFGTHVPAATDTNATIEELCCLCASCRCFKQRARLVVSSTHLLVRGCYIRTITAGVKVKNKSGRGSQGA